mmetsp:Transcript_1394/g.1696  ORF Transcript_1394/g.1696 Transcript_1394/m.1696 type:complete len:707 (+) Transcript_1394:439-2559(+)
MIFPHALFAGTCIIFKLLFPSLITYLARDTVLYFGLSVVYPWICTVLLLSQYRHPSSNDNRKETSNPSKTIKEGEIENITTAIVGSSSTSSLREKRRAINAKYKAPSSTRSSSHEASASSKKAPSSIPAKKHDYLRRRTTNSLSDNNLKKAKTSNASTGYSGPSSKLKNTSKNNVEKPSKKKQSPVQLFLASRRYNADEDNDDNTLQAASSYWLQYWILHNFVTGVGRMIYLLPIVGRIVSKSTWISALIVELQLLWIIWIYGLEWVLASNLKNESDRKHSYKVRPLPFLTQKLIPHITRSYERISLEIISAETWNKTICKKASSFLELTVMMRLLRESTTKQILHVMEYAHPFLIPGMTLLMPGFITEYGVIYVKTIVPSAKTFSAHKKTNSKKSISLKTLSLKETMNSLQYWVLQGLLSAILSWWSGILWWIPFSTHAIFCVWCHLQYSSNTWYHALEKELSAFGLLPPLSEGDQPLQIQDTLTLKVLSRVIQAIPSAKIAESSLLASKFQGDEDTINQKETNNNDQNLDSSKEKSTYVIPPPSSAFKHAQASPSAVSNGKDGNDCSADEMDDEAINQTGIDPDCLSNKIKTNVDPLVQSFETPASKRKSGGRNWNNKERINSYVDTTEYDGNVQSSIDIKKNIVAAKELDQKGKIECKEDDNDNQENSIIVTKLDQKETDEREILTPSSQQYRRSDRLRHKKK